MCVEEDVYGRKLCVEESGVWKKVLCGRNIYMKEIKSRDWHGWNFTGVVEMSYTNRDALVTHVWMARNNDVTDTSFKVTWISVQRLNCVICALVDGEWAKEKEDEDNSRF